MKRRRKRFHMADLRCGLIHRWKYMINVDSWLNLSVIPMKICHAKLEA